MACAIVCCIICFCVVLNLIVFLINISNITFLFLVKNTFFVMYKRFGGISIHVGEFCDRSAAYISCTNLKQEKYFLVYILYILGPFQVNESDFFSKKIFLPDVVANHSSINVINEIKVIMF